MSNLQSEYPNQRLGIDTETNSRAGAVNSFASPLWLNTLAGATGAVVQSGSASPGLTGATSRIAGTTGDLYVRTGGSTALYRCSKGGPATTAGATTGAVWTELV